MSARILLSIAIGITLLATGLWLATGRDVYTKFEVIQEVEKPVDPGDPFAGTGLYDNGQTKEVVRRPEFHFGLLPVPSGLFDKHILSVATFVGPVWALTLLALFARRRRDCGCA